MASDRRFAIGFAAHVLLMLAALGAFVWSFAVPGLIATRIVALLLVALTILLLWRLVRRSNDEMLRFVEAVRFDDMQARFTQSVGRSARLGEALDQAFASLRRDRAKLGEESRFNAALVDDMPVALLTVDPQGRVTLANKVARKLFNRHKTTQASDFDRYGSQLRSALTALEPGQTRTILLTLEAGTQRAIVRSGTLARFGGTVRVIAVQVIQQALNAVELAAQNDLVRVLTHEIMNSITPITSLAGTAALLVAEADQGNDPKIADARLAIETLARRADGILHFVETYRETTRPPQIHRRRFPAGPFVVELKRLFDAEARWPDVMIAMIVTPENHLIDADPDLLTQVAINLLRNAAEAASAHIADPRIGFRISALRSGRTLIEVEDNGPGVPDSIRHDIFLPFFTTRKDGTGIGLARQVMLAHDGSVEIDDRFTGGALFRLVL